MPWCCAMVPAMHGGGWHLYVGPRAVPAFARAATELPCALHLHYMSRQLLRGLHPTPQRTCALVFPSKGWQCIYGMGCASAGSVTGRYKQVGWLRVQRLCAGRVRSSTGLHRRAKEGEEGNPWGFPAGE